MRLQSLRRLVQLSCLAIAYCTFSAICHADAPVFRGLKEFNPPAAPDDSELRAIVGAKLIDGLGRLPVDDSVIVLRGNQIVAVGRRDEVPIPAGAKRFDAAGLSILPGLVDAHFHIGSSAQMYDRPPLFLANGVTSARDPGRPIEIYAPVRDSDQPVPRLFVTGPHFDQSPAAHPPNAVLIGSADEARLAVQRYFKQGSSAIKVYFRLPLDLIAATCQAAHDLEIPVTAHLELIDADDAIRAGLDGIEHVTSFGSALAEPEIAQRFRSDVFQQNAARKDGRYRLWAGLDLQNSPRTGPVLELIGERGTFISPTLGIFEQRAGDQGAEEYHVRGFEKMLEFVGMCQKAGACIVTGSHGRGPHSEEGWAFHHEMELLVESGLTPMEVIQASTINNARFFGCADRLGSIEAGKLADFVLVKGDPSQDIQAIYNVRHVMLNGAWIGEPAGS